MKAPVMVSGEWGPQKTREKWGAGGGRFRGYVRCIDCGQRYMGRVKSQNVIDAKEVLTRREVYFTIW